MIAAGTAGTVAAVLDCGQSSSSTTIFYGVACTGSECVPGGEDAAAALNDGGSSEDAAYLYDGGSSVNFYGVPCTGDACVPHIHGDAASPDANAADATSASDAGDE
jgi:hypothetical protein